MPRASELRKGMVVEIEGIPHSVKQTEARSPSSRGAVTIYKVRFLNLQNGTKLDSSFKGSEILLQANFDRVPIQYSYCLLYTSPSPRDRTRSRMPSSA